MSNPEQCRECDGTGWRMVSTKTEAGDYDERFVPCQHDSQPSNPERCPTCGSDKRKQRLMVGNVLEMPLVRCTDDHWHDSQPVAAPTFIGTDLANGPDETVFSCPKCHTVLERIPRAADPVAPLVEAFKKLQQHFHLAHSTSIMISPLSKCQNQVCVDGCAALAAYEGRQK